MTKRQPLPPVDDHCPVPILRIDTSGMVCAFNAAARDAFHLPPSRRRRAVSLLPGLKDTRIAEHIAAGAHAEFCTIAGGSVYHVWMIGMPRDDVAQLYCVPITDLRNAHASGAPLSAADSSRRGDELQQLVQTYQQQLKELSCIYGLAESLRTRESVEDICADLVSLVPPAWRRPDLARARIVLDGREYVSQEFEETRWGQSAAVVVNGRARGMVQVYYVREVPGSREHGPFLAAERKLLDAVARTLGESIERREFESDNRRKAIILAQERNRLETILRGIGEGVVVTDTNDIVLMMNAAAMQLLGLPNREPIAVNFLSLLDDATFRDTWRATAGSGEDFAKQDLHIAEPAEKTLQVTRSRIPELVQGADCFVTIFHDVTKDRAIDQMKTDFVAAVSHELRTPMTSIKGFVRTILRDPNMPQNLREHFLTIIDEETERLTHLIEALLEMGTIESGRAVLDLAPVDIRRTVDGIVSSLMPAMLNKQIEFVCDVPKDLPSPIADEKRVYTIICNLLENAIKFTPNAGRITFAAQRDGDFIALYVADTGIGVSEENRARIFERFYQVRGGSEKAPGAGLGLFLVKEMVTLHGGTVDVESVQGKGTTFRVRLPLTSTNPSG
ncbi:MAG: ATP-binding protein [Candidatus Hydrogenedentes bacterium]|nr:ATP-binding protein [Candidatus Hydrogenedentota bacterium]